LSESENDKKKKERVKQPLSKNIFIVHGRDHKPMEELKTMLYEFSLNPIVLHEQPSGSMTIIEKLERYSQDIGFAFILLTPDDALVPTTPMVGIVEEKGKAIGMQPLYIYDKKPIFRARQNVILEFGFLIAKVSRNKVCCLYRENTELPYDMPSDMHGIVYIPFKESVNEVRDMIIKELEVAGYKNLYPPPFPPPY
jgi:predicted nucleotide-binding protein